MGIPLDKRENGIEGRGIGGGLLVAAVVITIFLLLGWEPILAIIPICAVAIAMMYLGQRGMR